MDLQGVRLNSTNHTLRAVPEKMDVEEVGTRPTALSLYSEGVVGQMKGRGVPQGSSDIPLSVTNSMWRG